MCVFLIYGNAANIFFSILEQYILDNSYCIICQYLKKQTQIQFLQPVVLDSNPTSLDPPSWDWLKPRGVTGLGTECPALDRKGSGPFVLHEVTSLKEETSSNLHWPDSRCTGCGIVMYLTYLTHNYNLETSDFNIQGFGFAISKHSFILSFTYSTSIYCVLKIY